MGCCCEWRAPKPLRYVLPCVIVGVIVYLYSAFVFFAHGRVLKGGASPWELYLFHGLTLMLCWSLTQTLRSRDSFLARRTLSQAPVQGLTGQSNDVDDSQQVECKMNGAVRTCRKCRALKPDRTHHCSTCRRCVLKMDHHCVYINKCIGYFNYKFFVLFLGWSAATCLYQSSLLYRYVLGESLNRATTFYFGKLGLVNPHLQIVSVFFGSTCLGLALACFYIMHLHFVANNYSTLEYCEKRDDPDYVNYYNVGVRRNFQEVFGTFRELPYWFIPVHSPSFWKRDGKTFPLNKFIKAD